MAEVRGSYSLTEIQFASGPFSVGGATGPDGRPARLSMLELPAGLSEPERAALVATLEREAAARPAAPPALLPVLACGEADGILWLAEEAPSGRSLRAIVAADGPLEPEGIIPILHQIGTMLDPLHAANLAHAWLLPDHVYPESGVALGGQPWAAVASALRAMRPGEAWPESDFLAPETRAGTAPDVKAEAYSAAALAIFAATGHAPAPGLSLAGAPAGVTAALMRSLDHDPAGRHPGAKALAVDLTVERAIAMPDAADQTDVPSGGDVPDWARDLLKETAARRESGMPLVEMATESANASQPSAGPSAPPPPRSTAAPAAPPPKPSALGPAPEPAPDPQPIKPTSDAPGFDWSGGREQRSWTSVALAAVSLLFVLAAIALTLMK